ncbi:hypothetical protein JCM10908_000249 [Rhodotorula pacifica]|uniref:Iba57p n=1 Tax=Rhodotorula pacifica TaxID=1495444 RepID=UPI003178BD58
MQSLRSAVPLPRCTCSFRRPFASSSRSLAPPFVYTALPSRALLAVQGQDATGFLQGLVSNDVRRLAPRGDEDNPEKQRILYANILKADGRYMHDIMLHRSLSPEDDPATSFLIDHDAAATSSLRTYLKRHKLRSKLKIGTGAEPDQVVIAAWRNPLDVGEGQSTEAELAQAEEWLEGRKKGWDPRVVGMGRRWVERTDGEKPPSELFEPVTPEHHHLHRLVHAVPEGPADFPALPLEANIDFMNGVDYRKGCYVGQELTARTHHKGIVRKRGMIFRLFREGEDIPMEPLPSHELIPYPSLFPLPPPGSSLTLLRAASSRRPRASGKLGSSLALISLSGNLQTVALAYGSVRTDHLGEGTDEFDGVFTVKAEISDEAVLASAGGESTNGEPVELGNGAGESDEAGGRWLAKAFMPAWLEFKLEEEAIAKGL